ncbi:integrase core domain-containing protein [Nocardia gipuzkoensis]
MEKKFSINALAESIIGLFETEVVNRHGPSKKLTEVEFALMEWVDLYNNARLHSPLDYLTPPNTRAPTTLNHHADRRWSEPEAGPEPVTVHSVSTRHNQATSILPRTTRASSATNRHQLDFIGRSERNRISARPRHALASIGCDTSPRPAAHRGHRCSCLEWVCGFYHQPPTRQLQVARVPIFDVPRRGHEPATFDVQPSSGKRRGDGPYPHANRLQRAGSSDRNSWRILGRDPHTKQVRHGDRA